MKTSLMVVKPSKFDNLRKQLMLLFLKDTYFMMQRLDALLIPKQINISEIIIPKEIGKRNYEKY